MNATSGFAQIVYLSTATSRKPSRLHVSVNITGLDPTYRDRNNTGVLANTAIAFCEQVHTVDASRLTEWQGRVDPSELDLIDDAIFWSLGLDPDQAD